MTTITGLFIPDNMWRPVETIELDVSDEGRTDLEQVRHLIGCRMVEVIHPTTDSDVHVDGELGWHVALGDEEGRYDPFAQNNHRATQLLGFPYYIVGAVVVLGDSMIGYESRFTSVRSDLLFTMQAKQHLRRVQ